MSDALKEHGPKVFAGLAAIASAYLLYSCLMGKEEPDPAQITDVKVEGEKDAASVVVAAADEKVEVVCADDIATDDVTEVTNEDALQSQVEKAEASLARANNAMLAGINKRLEGANVQLKLKEEEEVAAAAAAEQARIDQQKAEAEAKEKAAAAAKATADKKAKAEADAAAALKKQQEAEALRKQKEAEAAAALKAKELAAQKAKEEEEKRRIEEQKRAEAAAKAQAVKDKIAREQAEAARIRAIPNGTLELTCQNAKIFINTDNIGTMDPYVHFSMTDANNKVVWEDKTEPHVSGHQAPKWNKKFLVPVKDYNHKMSFTIYEKDMMGKDLIGNGSFQPIQYTQAHGNPNTPAAPFQRAYKDSKESAQLYLSGVWKPKM